MKKKKSGLPQSDMRLYFVVMALFAAATYAVSPWLALGETGVFLLTLLYFQSVSRKRQEDIQQYIENVTDGIQTVEKASVSNAPIPVAVFRPENMEILWSNACFQMMAGRKKGLFEMRMTEIAPTFSSRWLLEGKTESPETVTVGDRHFRVFGSVSRTAGGRHGSGTLLATTYWKDVTETDALREFSEAHRPVVCVVLIDNYEDLTKAGTEAARSAVLAQIDEKLNEWIAGTHALLLRYDRNRYLLSLNEEEYVKLESSRFSVLDAVRGIVTQDGVAATLSIGVGRDADEFETLFRRATLSIEMALSRGGDQVVVRDHVDFTFYGGKSKATERQTKVKARVMARALGELISDASQIYVMGHSQADMDTLGAAAGICAIARKRGKTAQIVLDEEECVAQDVLKKLKALPEYRNAFIDGNDAFIGVQPGALLVVVDTNRPDIVESEQLLDACNRVAVIDHHRRAASYIESAALNYHEPYASSASEMVSELLQYLIEPSGILHAEAEALLAGIVLDTKNFTMRTGSRTFDAAAFLRRVGADTAAVQELFRGDLTEMLRRCEIIRCTEMPFDGIAVSATEEEIDRVSASKAADELLMLSGVQASFVLYRHGTGVDISARSLGEINVQLIMEKLGGGGNAATAGGQVPDGTVDAVREQLLAAITEYREENKGGQTI